MIAGKGDVGIYRVFISLLPKFYSSIAPFFKFIWAYTDFWFRSAHDGRRFVSIQEFDFQLREQGGTKRIAKEGIVTITRGGKRRKLFLFHGFKNVRKGLFLPGAG